MKKGYVAVIRFVTAAPGEFAETSHQFGMPEKNALVGSHNYVVSGLIEVTKRSCRSIKPSVIGIGGNVWRFAYHRKNGGKRLDD